MIDVHQLRKGTTFLLDGEIYKDIEFQHHKPGRGKAIIRTRIRNLRTGATIDKNFISGDRVEDIRIDRIEVQYLYNDGQFYYFMNTETYEQIYLPEELLGDSLPYLVPNILLQVQFFEGEPIGVELQGSVELRVISTEPVLKGATVSNVTKPATLETGLVIQVPPFINEGEIIRVDTSDGKYLERVKG